ncbi:MAG: hypothetical protein AB3N23_22430 [Paracoccaceae bacterium]
MSSTDPFRNYPRTLARLPRVMRLYILHCIVGFALSAVFTSAILWLNVAGIGHLVANVSGGWLAVLVFFTLNGIVFSGVQTAVVLWSMDYDDGTAGGGGRPIHLGEPARVRAVAPTKTAKAWAQPRNL